MLKFRTIVFFCLFSVLQGCNNTLGTPITDPAGTAVTTLDAADPGITTGIVSSDGGASQTPITQPTQTSGQIVDISIGQC